MGSYKTYYVMKNGENLKTVRSLQTAKELAEQAGAEVVCDGECIYKANVGERYIITSLMNVRSFPGGEILGTAPAGTVVEVYELKDCQLERWLCIYSIRKWSIRRQGLGPVFIYGGENGKGYE